MRPQLLARKFPKDRSIIYVAYVQRLVGLGGAGVSSIGSLLCTLYLVAIAGVNAAGTGKNL